MMLKLAKLGLAMAVLAVLIVPAAYAGVPDITQSFFVPQSGPVATPTEGAAAIKSAIRCPNNENVPPLFPNAARLKVVVKASDGTPIVGIPASDICVLFNGGTPAQGFSGVGDDSIAANFQYNQTANCPNIRCVPADGPTDATGTTYITWMGHAASDPPGVVTNRAVSRDAFRKWGGYAGDIPVMVLGFKLQGKLTTASALGSYTAHVRSLDHTGSEVLLPNQGELVNSFDLAGPKANFGGPYPVNSFKYKWDFDGSGAVDAFDYAFIRAHLLHDCDTPTLN
jgi:hypothetical protein